MKRSKSYMFRSERNKKRKVLPTILITAIVLLSAGIVTWIGLNDWNIEKSYKRVEAAINQTMQKNQDDSLPVEEPKEDEESTQVGGDSEAPTKDDADDELTIEEAIQYIEGQELPQEPTYIDGILLANKKHPLPSTYAPGESKEAREAFEKMAAAALLEDYHLHAFSTYRSFEYQTSLYDRYVERDGAEEADRYSARPGYSEHQTGLAFDIGEINKEQDWASSSFAHTEAGQWLAENAHLYGFILRYPEGKESITGYMYESWHFRYVGIEVAKDIYENDLTLEEYLEL